MDRAIFYNNQCIKLDLFMVRTFVDAGRDQLKCNIMKAFKFFYCYCNYLRIASLIKLYVVAC